MYSYNYEQVFTNFINSLQPDKQKTVKRFLHFNKAAILNIIDSLLNELKQPGDVLSKYKDYAPNSIILKDLEYTVLQFIEYYKSDCFIIDDSCIIVIG